MGDDDVDDVGDDVLSCPGSYYCFSPTLLPPRRAGDCCADAVGESVAERAARSISRAHKAPPLALWPLDVLDRGTLSAS